MKSCLVDWEYLRFAHFRRAAVTAGEVSAAAQAGGQTLGGARIPFKLYDKWAGCIL